MKLTKYRLFLEELLLEADIRINGDRPWDIHAKNENLYRRVLSKGSVGLGEAYMDGWWECDALEEFFNRILQARIDTKIKLNFRKIWVYLINEHIQDAKSLKDCLLRGQARVGTSKN